MPTLASPTASREPARTPAAAAKPAGQVIAVAGIRLYRTRAGQLIELPPDMTNEEAARLESEGTAAEKKLGRRPAPAPVPDVRKPAKEAKPEPPRKHAASRGGLARAKAAAKAAQAAAGALLGAVGGSKVAQYLAARALPVLARGSAMLAKLAQNEQTHHDAGEKLAQSEDAVVVPKSEEQSTGNAGQVETVSGRPAPAVEQAKAEDRLSQSIQDNIPHTLEDVDNFERDKRAQHMSADVLEVVQSDKNSVMTTFGEVRRTPAPIPSGHVPVALPAPEAAPATPAMNLGKGAVAPLEKEHTDLSSYTREADAKLQEEGVTQEQLDMVDSGELAQANKEKKGLEQKAKTEPAAVQQFARLETERVDRELAHEEKTGRDAMAARRRAALGATGQKQRGTKTALEKQRDDVAAKINGMYKAAQDSVTKKLADLETQSMKRFDEGNARAAKTFEEKVKREFEAYKADRYSGWFGWARKAKDWLLGMEDLPRVKEIFERNRTQFVTTVNKLVEQITADNKRVIEQCRNELAEARKAIQRFVAGLGPALRDVGRKAAAEMNERLTDLDNKIGAKEEELRGKLKDKQTAAIRAIDDKIAKMKEAMSGALAKLGRLLLYAAKKFFSWALGKFGVSLSTIEGIIDKGVAVLKAIFTGPIKFVKNLVHAAGRGFENFGKNFLTHLKNAVFAWLTGTLEGVTLPDTWNLRGILSVVFQLLGITYQNIRAHLVKLVPEPVVKSLETTFSVLKTLVTQGPMAAWEQLKEIAGELQNAFVDAVKNWIKWKIVQKAIETILSMFIPGAGIIRAIIGIYDTIVFFIQKAKQIIEMVGNFLGSIAEIAAGNIGAAAQALEDGLARGLKLVIEFLARFLHLDGITAKIREVIQTIRGKVDAVIEKIAVWIVGLAKKAGGFVVGAAKSAAGAVAQWWRRRISFRTESGQQHSIFLEGEPPATRVAVQSDRAFLEDLVAKLKGNDKKKGEALRAEIERSIRGLDALGARGRVGAKEDDKEMKRLGDSLDANLAKMGELLADADVLDAGVTGLPRPAYNFEFSDDRAHGATVENLSANRPMGSEPYQNPLGWDYLQASGQTTDKAPYYRRLHLVNHRLGGPGQRQNLVPGSQENNSEMERDYERPIKDLVGHEPLQAKYRAIVTMRVRVEYKRSVSIGSSKYTSRDFPSKIECSYEYKESPRKPKQRGTPVTLNVPAPK